ncbi:MAG: hypothetical protein N4A44_04190 [Alphaproteobacteria bacterium]|jgi:hypothetical protein|nr:hypothetical protein [Alphaproteobacteria bacterium]
MGKEVYTEIGIGNETFINSQINDENHNEERVKGFISMNFKQVYFRIWFAWFVVGITFPSIWFRKHKKQMIFELGGIRFTLKNKFRFKCLFGMYGIKRENIVDLYHGSRFKLKVGDFLKPNNTNNWKREGFKNRVCATPIRDLAEKFAFRKSIHSKSSFFDSDIFIISSFELTGDKMYIYKVDSCGMDKVNDSEYVSEKSVRIKEVIEVVSPLDYYKRRNLNLYLSKVDLSELKKVESSWNSEKESKKEFWDKHPEKDKYLLKIDDKYIEKINKKRVKL